MPSIHKLTGSNNLPSFSEYFDINMPEVELDINEIKDNIKKVKVPELVQKEIFSLLDNSIYDIIEKKYTDYISSKYDSHFSARSDSCRD